MLDIRDSFPRKILLRPMTIGSGGSSIDNHLFVSHSLPPVQNICELIPLDEYAHPPPGFHIPDR